MSNRGKLVEFLMAFFVCSTCISILEGLLGMAFFAEDKFGWEAFFSPPLFGFLSVLLGMVTKSERELSVKEILFRRALHLFLIELLIFGMNYAAGMQFDALFSVTLAFSVAAVFVAVYVVMWLNDRKSAALFNEKLKEYQGRI
ncbi:MAG: DUF3021 family protein [Lachnospiraceae bacterium]|jgi:hypothetical protein|nr:DUF3021 family protein [Lachnospiraceae bacterium]